MRGLTTLFLLTCSAHLLAASGSASLDPAVLQRMAALPAGQTIAVAAFPAGPGIVTSFEFRRIEVYAPNARIFVIDESGQHQIPRSKRVHLLGYSTDGISRASLSLDPDLASPPSGMGVGSSGNFIIHAEPSDTGWKFSAVRANDTLPDGVKPHYEDGIDSLPNPNATPSLLPGLNASGLQAPNGSTQLRVALVAVDTDTSFMSERFGGNTTQATTWIASLFAAMNIIYERDLSVHLQQGDTFLRTASDPYTNTDSPASSAALNQFGNYWQANYSSGGNAVDRDFAMLLSGNSSSQNSSSGIAWVNSYCQTSGNGGSYSVTQVFTNPGFPASFSAFVVSHELGHNFGAAHTHCSNSNTGNYPTASNTIDKCYSGESQCYSGAVSCPSGTPDAPQGTLMSYCHVSSANCGDNVLKFHPTHISLLNARIAANTPSCLSEGNDVIFAGSFE